MPQYHPLLDRQLRRAKLPRSPQAWATSPQAELLALVDQAYRDNDSDVALAERAADLASREMQALQAALRAERDALERTVETRTEALEMSERRTLSLLRMSTDWFWECDTALRMTRLSSGFERVTGQPATTAAGRTPHEIWPDCPALRPGGTLHRAFIRRQPFSDLHIIIRRPDGQAVELLVSGEPAHDRNGVLRGFIGVAHDVTAERRADREVQRLVWLDGLTGLGNRRQFQRDALRAVNRQQPFTLTLIDLDAFKAINDAQGHHAGDQLLMLVAARLRAAAHPQDSVYRLSGDEFVILSRGEAPATPERLLRDTLPSLSPGNRIGEDTAHIRASMGSASCPEHATDLDRLFVAADVAMYTAKRSGGNRHLYYSATLHDDWEKRATLTQSLSSAFDRDELVLAYQPIADCRSRDIRGFEALLRWPTCPVAGFSPQRVVQHAEANGLVTKLTQWCARALARDAATLLARHPGAYLSINMTPSQVVDPPAFDALLALHDALRQRGGSLLVELTESPTVVPAEAVARVMRAVAAAGIAVALDDFGQGMSSLARLVEMTIHRVKLDRLLVAQLDRDASRQHVVLAMLMMARALGVSVTAEGVETEAELAALQAIGVPEAQGYLLGRPALPGVWSAAQ